MYLLTVVVNRHLSCERTSSRSFLAVEVALLKVLPGYKGRPGFSAKLDSSSAEDGCWADLNNTLG